MILIINYYECENLERQNEYIKCILLNLSNKYIEKIVLITDNNYNLDFIKEKKNKIIQINLLNTNSKLTYKIAFDIANDYFKNYKCIIANTDIYFDDSIKLFNTISFTNKFFCLSRYEEENKNEMGKFAPYFSQDSWIFESPVNINTDNLDFPLGEMGCDGKIAYEFYNQSYQINNPCLSIKSIHVHKSDFRTYMRRNQLPKPYVWTYACKIDDQSIVCIRDQYKIRPIKNNQVPKK